MGEGMRQAMERAELNGREAAHLLSWSPSWVSRLLSGKRGGSALDIARLPLGLVIPLTPPLPSSPTPAPQPNQSTQQAKPE
ncbi:MAG: helix-turn-helix domain-containing protein [Pseudonocardiaceae bacterium]